MSIKKHIPNAVTCGNLLCGCLAIASAFNGNLVGAAYLVGIAAVLDFFDGFAARLLKVGGEMGKQLDSLADMVTFGVVPGVIIYKLLSPDASYTIHDAYFVFNRNPYVQYTGFIITVFSALRLAKFNIDTRQTTSFIGVPTPANAMLICSLPLIMFAQPAIAGMDKAAFTDLLLFLNNTYFLVTLSLLMSCLLVAELPLFALKFKNFSWTGNKLRYSFLIISVLLLILFQFVAIPFIIFLYIILSVINNRIRKVPAQ